MANQRPSRLYTREQVATLNERGLNLAIIIDNIVYDVTNFLLDHPGGQEVLQDNAGKDVSEAFHEVGHSEIALDWRNKMKLGELVEADCRPVEKKEKPSIDWVPQPFPMLELVKDLGPAVLLVIVAAILYYVMYSETISETT